MVACIRNCSCYFTQIIFELSFRRYLNRNLHLMQIGQLNSLRLGRNRYNGKCTLLISANLTIQSMYIQDFPRHLPSSRSPADTLPQFASELLFYIKAQGLPSHVLEKVREYNFSTSEGIEFVHSISGDNFDSLNRHGKNGLASAIERLGLKPSSQSDILQLCYVVRNSTLVLP